jgi:hypothetical protein
MSRAACRKSLSGRRSPEERCGTSVEGFDAPDVDFRRSPKGRGSFAHRGRLVVAHDALASHRFYFLPGAQNSQRRGHDDSSSRL